MGNIGNVYVYRNFIYVFFNSENIIYKTRYFGYPTGKWLKILNMALKYSSTT